jgi:hypothetical protein
LLENDPNPPVSVVLLLEIVGLADVFQQIPLEMIEAPPSFVASPPQVAVVYDISVTDVVIIIGGVGLSSLQEIVNIIKIIMNDIPNKYFIIDSLFKNEKNIEHKKS